MARTTIRFDDELLAQVKAYAARHRTSLNSVVEDAVRELISRSETTSRPDTKIDLHFYGGKANGLRPGVELDDNAALADVMDADVPVERQR